MKITTLCENSVPISKGLVGEHGLAFLIETGGSTVLFDTGQGIGLEKNAAELGKDLSAVTHIVLSHGHYDHTGGLGIALEKAPKAQVTAHPGVFGEKVGILPGRDPVDIGMPFERSYIESRARLHLDEKPREIAGGVRTTGEIPMTTPFERVDEGLFVKEGGETVKDGVPDDLALVLDTPGGPVVVVGCSHRGVVNILLHAKNLTGADGIRAVLGGMHLERASEDQLRGTIAAFERLGIEMIVMSHCSGLEASAKVYGALQGRVAFNRVGAEFEL